MYRFAATKVVKKIPLVLMKFYTIKPKSKFSKNKVVFENIHRSLKKLNLNGEKREGKINDMHLKNLQKDFKKLNLNHKTRKEKLKKAPFKNFQRDLKRLNVSKPIPSQKESRFWKFKTSAALVADFSTKAERSAAEAKDTAIEAKEDTTKEAADTAKDKAENEALETLNATAKITSIILVLLGIPFSNILPNDSAFIEQNSFN